MPNSLTALIGTLAEEAKSHYREIIWQAASGEDIDPQEALNAGIAVGKSAHQIQLDVALVESRIKIHHEYKGGDLEKSQSDAVAQRNESQDAMSKSEIKLIAAQEAHQELRKQHVACTATINRIMKEREDLRREFMSIMKKTGNPNSDDIQDPKNFMI